MDAVRSIAHRCRDYGVFLFGQEHVHDSPDLLSSLISVVRTDGPVLAMVYRQTVAPDRLLGRSEFVSHRCGLRS